MLEQQQTSTPTAPENPGARPNEPQKLPAGLRTVHFGGWTGSATSEHFQIKQLNMTPYNTAGSTGLFDLLPDMAFANLVAGGGAS